MSVMSVLISLPEWVPTVFWKLSLLEDKADSFEASFGEKVVKSSHLIKENQRQHESVVRDWKKPSVKSSRYFKITKRK